MEALTVSGYTIKESGGLGHRPSFPSTMVLNDFIAGYMGAAGVIAALRAAVIARARRARPKWESILAVLQSELPSVAGSTGHASQTHGPVGFR